MNRRLVWDWSGFRLEAEFPHPAPVRIEIRRSTYCLAVPVLRDRGEVKALGHPLHQGQVHSANQVPVLAGQVVIRTVVRAG